MDDEYNHQRRVSTNDSGHGLMAIRVSIPNVKQQVTDTSGYVSKAWFDFFRTLWERTGGNQDSVSELEDEVNVADLLIFRNRIATLEQRVRALESQLDSLGA